MCDMCADSGEMTSCQYCGRLICFDENGYDDVVSRAAVTPGGDVGCLPCVAEQEREELEAEPLDWFDPDDEV